MTCFNCGAENVDGSSVCINCGSNLGIDPRLNINNEGIKNSESVEQQLVEEPKINISQPINNQVVNSQANFDQQPINITTSPLNYLKFITAVLIKPFKYFKEEESRLCETKTSIILSLIVALGMVFIRLIETIFSTVFAKTLDPSTLTYKTTLDFGRLKNVQWGDLLGKNLLIYAGVVVGIALVYYILSLMFKKNVNFLKMLSISATSIIPYILLGMIVSPIVGKIWFPLSIVSMFAGGIYSILIFVNLIDDAVLFDNVDTKIYFHLIGLTILGCVGYYLYIKLLESSVTNSINDLLNILG